ncbi:MAG: fused MFS/spermidine synthase [Myxococcota bacterium]
MRRAVLAMFVVSGAAALVFEVALQRSLTRAFGVSAFATSTVLAAWMAGLALGALLFGRAADRARRPLRLYALLELGIAGWAVCTPTLVPAVISGFSRLAQGHDSDAPPVIFGRAALAFGVCLVPTILMGGTLPAVARALSALGSGAEREVARLYTANILGAAAGAALAAYVVLPALGLSRAMWLGAALNVIAAGLAVGLARNVAPQDPAPRSVQRGPARWELLAASAWSGFATFLAEVTWFQLLAVVVGTSAYAFGLMLAVFLVGLTAGAAWLARRKDEAIGWGLFGRTQLAVVIAVALTLPLWDRVPSLFVLAGTAVEGFAAQEAVRALACVELLFVPAAILGAVYPLTLRVAAREAAVGRSIGGLSAANTLGAVLGALLTGFVLLPRFGSRGVLLILIAGSAVVAAIALKGRWRLAPLFAAGLAFLLPPWNLARLASGENVYFRPTSYAEAEVLWAHESVQGGLTSVVKHPKTGTTTLLTNGKFQGNDTGEVSAQRAFTQLPMLVQHRWGRALLIGVGTGCSLGTLAAQPYGRVEAAELSPDVITASREFFGRVNDGVLSSPRVTVHLADGRNHLLLRPDPLDLVSIELSSIWFAGAADLYNREFNALVRQRLNPGGVLQQWVQLHHLTRRDLAVILQSIRAELPHLALFFQGGQGIVLASAEPLTLDYPGLVKLSRSLSGTSATAGLPAGDVLTLNGRLVLNEQGVAALIAEEAAKEGVAPEALASTDDSLRLEYSTPRANADDSLDQQTLLASLSHLPHLPLPAMDVPGPAQAAHVQAAWLIGRGELEEARRVLEDPTNACPESEPLRTWLAAQPKSRTPAGPGE